MTPPSLAILGGSSALIAALRDAQPSTSFLHIPHDPQHHNPPSLHTRPCDHNLPSDLIRSLSGVESCIYVESETQNYTDRLQQYHPRDLLLSRAHALSIALGSLPISNVLHIQNTPNPTTHALLTQSPAHAFLPEQAPPELQAVARSLLSLLPHHPNVPHTPNNDVGSIQRIPLPHAMTAQEVARAYMAWLPSYMRSTVRVQPQTDTHWTIRTPLLPIPVLSFKRLDAPNTTPDLCAYRIHAGVLLNASTHLQGRLCFHTFPNLPFTLTAIHNFTPRLPWFVYRHTQARAHARVMDAFAQHLVRVPLPE